MRFAIRLSATAFVLVFAAVLAVVLLASRSIDRSLDSLNEARLRLVLSSLAGTIQANLDLGLPLADLRRVQELIERTLSAEPGLRAIEVMGAEGTALFSTDRGAVGEAAPGPWLAAMAERRSTPLWRVVDRGETVIGLPIESDIGRIAGQVALVVPTEELAWEESPELLAAGQLGWLALLAGSVAGVMTFGLARRRQNRLNDLAANFAGKPTGSPGSANLPQVLALAGATSAQALAKLEAAHRDLEQVDHAL